MADEPRTFSQARARLEEIVVQVRKKDTSLEKSLDLLEEGVKLANQCTELIDHADWEDAGGEGEPAPGDGEAGVGAGDERAGAGVGQADAMDAVPAPDAGSDGIDDDVNEPSDEVETD